MCRLTDPVPLPVPRYSAEAPFTPINTPRHTPPPSLTSTDYLSDSEVAADVDEAVAAYGRLAPWVAYISGPTAPTPPTRWQRVKRAWRKLWRR